MNESCCFKSLGKRGIHPTGNPVFLSPLFSCLFLVDILDTYLGILLAPLWPVPSYHLCYMVFVGQFTADTDMCRLADTDICVFIKVNCYGTLLTIQCYLSVNEGLVPHLPRGKCSSDARQTVVPLGICSLLRILTIH